MLRRAGGSKNEGKRLTRTKSALLKDLRLIFSEDDLQKWLDAPNDRLGGRKPAELLDSPEQQRLVDMVEAVKLGLPT
jgi:uncharacterized protein (DUF2384 family)